MNISQAVELTRRYHHRLGALSTAVAALLAHVWDDLGSWDRQDIARFQTGALPLVAGAQQKASTLTLGYLGLLLGTSVTIDPLDLTNDFEDPFLGYWAALTAGAAWEQAVTTGRTRSETLGLDGTIQAARQTTVAVDNTQPRIVGWERVTDGYCCEWCATVATQRYHTAESASFGHNRCGCINVPIIGSTAPGRVINRQLLDNLKRIPADQRTGYVNADGTPAPRPDAAPVAAP